MHERVVFTVKANVTTDPERAVPASCAQSHPICANPQTADSVFVACQYTNTLSLECIPDIARPVIITTKEDTAGDRERNGRDTTQNIVVCESV